MKTSDQDYIERAIQILSDTEQTSFSKGVAKDLLRNSGFTEREIRQFTSMDNNYPICFIMA